MSLKMKLYSRKWQPLVQTLKLLIILKIFFLDKFFLVFYSRNKSFFSSDTESDIFESASNEVLENNLCPRAMNRRKIRTRRFTARFRRKKSRNRRDDQNDGKILILKRIRRSSPPVANWSPLGLQFWLVFLFPTL